MPLKPSLPPHLTPMVKALSGLGSLSILLISVNPKKVFLMASQINCSSLCDFCCSKTYIGLLNDGLRFLRSFKKYSTCKCWHPKLRSEEHTSELQSRQYLV